MKIELTVVVCVVHLFFSTQLCCQALELNMMPNAFDDQYICCEDEMEREMEKVLKEERKHEQLNKMWDLATTEWNEHKSNFPTLKDNYGVALVLYTMNGNDYPTPIYAQLNYNISIAGESRDHYMKDFHFKALHFYLTRALQELRKGCAQRFTTYRGSKVSYTVSSQLRFGKFASSSKNEKKAEEFGTTTFFTISTCLGVYIADLSDYPDEEEVLIPVSETFRKLNNNGNNYTLESTGELCSYFNCAYLGGEKRKSPECISASVKSNAEPMRKGGDIPERSSLCNSGEERKSPECICAFVKSNAVPMRKGTFLHSWSRTCFFFLGLVLNVVILLLP